MIKRLFDGIFGSQGDAALSASPGVTSSASSEMSEPQSSATADIDDAAQFGRWRAADDTDNPFGVEGFDC
jgi:hypothetical protein